MDIQFDEASDLLAMIDNRAAKYGDKTVFTHYINSDEVEASYTYRSLLLRVKSVAFHLQQEGLSGQRVLLAYQPGLEFIIGFYASLLAGAIAVPVVPPQNTRNGTNFDKILSDCGASAVLSDTKYGRRLKSIFKDQQSGESKKYIFTDEIDDSKAGAWIERSAKPSDIAFLQYTSGSTSDPKGVVVSHANLMQNLAMQKAYFQITDQEKFVNWLPHFHDMGLIGNILLTLFCGAHCSVMSPSAFAKKPFDWLKLISDTSATFTGSPNFGYQLCVDRVTEEQLKALDLSSLRNAYCGSEPIRPSTLIDFYAKFSAAGLQPEALTPCYGMAEATLIISGGSSESEPVIRHFDKEQLMQAVAQPCAEQDSGAVALVGCGHINNGQAVVIVDPETSKPLTDGYVGEIWVSGASVCQGYWSNPESTENTFQARLITVSDDAHKDLVFVRSGDLGFIHDGELYVSGRSKDIIIINGKNYYPQDIELAVANAHPDLVKDGGATFSVVDKDGLEQVIVTHEITRVRARDHDFNAIRKSAVAVISELFEIELAGFVLLKPGRVAKTSSGKIKRGASKAAYMNDELEYLDVWFSPGYLSINEPNDEIVDIEASCADINDIESVQLWLQQLVAAYQSLDIDDLDVFRPLAEYGLTSVTIMKILGDISQEIDQEVEPTLIWEYPTINELSNKIVSMVLA